VDNMKLRISQLDPSAREGVYQYVRESIESDGQGMQGGDSNKAFNDLCQNITDPFFIDLLNRPHGDEVVFTKAYFISILRFLLDLAQDVQAGAFLSIQEETLLKMSESIKNCSVGKKESITLAYKTIPKEYRYENETEDLPVAVKALEFIENSISSYILHLFTSEDPFLYDIQGSREKLFQLSHHSLYLKNRMAAFVGLDHNIQFDLHTEVLKNEFINKDIHTLLQMFYRHFTVESLVSLMQKIYNEAPGSACLFEGFSQILEPLNATDIWIVDEDPPYKVSLSKNGALQLLLECGYVKKYAKRARKS